jgi:phosphoglycolate phosphatase-like HAD superfamily hydrolase
VGVVTSKDRVQFDKEVSHFPIIAKMPIVTTADLTKNPKPSGEPITYTLERFNLARERTLYVGDSIFDMQASKNAGVDFVVAKWGALPNVDFNNAKYQAKTPNDIVGIVQ